DLTKSLSSIVGFVDLGTKNEHRPPISAKQRFCNRIIQPFSYFASLLELQHAQLRMAFLQLPQQTGKSRLLLAVNSGRPHDENIAVEAKGLRNGRGQGNALWKRKDHTLDTRITRLQFGGCNRRGCARPMKCHVGTSFEEIHLSSPP